MQAAHTEPPRSQFAATVVHSFHISEGTNPAHFWGTPTLPISWCPQPRSALAARPPLELASGHPWAGSVSPWIQQGLEHSPKALGLHFPVLHSVPSQGQPSDSPEFCLHPCRGGVQFYQLCFTWDPQRQNSPSWHIRTLLHPGPGKMPKAAGFPHQHCWSGLELCRDEWPAEGLYHCPCLCPASASDTWNTHLC